MNHPLDDTIAALSTASGGAARGVLRISGPQAGACAAACFAADAAGDDWHAGTAPRVVAGSIRGEASPPLPCELYYWPGRRSYTRQPVAELHTLGSPPLLETLLRQVCAAGARLAAPGEFTLRAFLAGQLDLTQAEAVLGVIDAQTAPQLDAALAQLAGGISRPMTELRESLLDLLAHLEAGLDFVEEDLEFISHQELADQLGAAESTIRRLAAQMQSRNAGAAKARVVLVGQPNAGKSSLFNALAGEAAALVSNTPGTTRDYLVAPLEIHGVACDLIDTAGVELEHAAETLAGAAQAMTAARQQQAQVRLLCLDATRPLNAWEQAQLASPLEKIVVLTKTDLPAALELACPAIATSSTTGAGLDPLRAAIAAAVDQSLALSAETVAGTAARCTESLRHAADALQMARALNDSGGGEELVAAEVRAALDELGKVVGAVYTDDILDRIFSRFCIGK